MLNLALSWAYGDGVELVFIYVTLVNQPIGLKYKTSIPVLMDLTIKSLSIFNPLFFYQVKNVSNLL